MATDDSTTKRCTQCGTVKALTDFAPCRNQWRTHRNAACRHCKRAAANRARNPGVPPAETVTKECTACGNTKCGSEFRKTKGGRYGLSSECKACLKIRFAAYRTTPRYRERTDAWQRLHKLRGYGLSPQEYQAMLDAQGGVCAICGRLETARGNAGAVRDLCVDHDHVTGKVRGLLCALCNASLGGFRDDSVVLQAAINYLKLHSAS